MEGLSHRQLVKPCLSAHSITLNLQIIRLRCITIRPPSLQENLPNQDTGRAANADIAFRPACKSAVPLRAVMSRT
jgi:hypothetical protein